MRIYKYRLNTNKGRQVIDAHAILNVIKVDVVKDAAFMWCVVDETRPKEYALDTLFTGDEPSNGQYIGTTLHFDGAYVLHHFIYL